MSFEALREFRLIASHQVKAGWAGVSVWAGALSSGDLQEFTQAGGTTTLMLFLAWTLGGLVCLQALRSSGRSCALMSIVAGCAFIQLLVIQFVTGISMLRIYPLIPSGILIIGLVVSNGNPVYLRRIACGFVVGLILLEVTQGAAFVAKVTKEWAKRDPNRMEPIVAQFAGANKVAAASRFWFYCRRRGIEFELIDYGFGPGRLYWEANSSRLKEFDVVVLPEGHPLLTARALEGFPWETVHDGDFDTYRIYRPRREVAAGQ
jgi:hypothetical protein